MASSNDLKSNPRYLQLAYFSFFALQFFDCFMLATMSPLLFPASIFSGPTQFFIRANATNLFPLTLLIFLLRKHHISTSVGRRVLWVFTLFHGLVFLLVMWFWLYGPWVLDLYWASLSVHGVWFVCGVAALAGY